MTRIYYFIYNFTYGLDIPPAQKSFCKIWRTASETFSPSHFPSPLTISQYLALCKVTKTLSRDRLETSIYIYIYICDDSLTKVHAEDVWQHLQVNREEELYIYQ